MAFISKEKISIIYLLLYKTYTIEHSSIGFVESFGGHKQIIFIYVT